jgi:hypothetical protein
MTNQTNEEINVKGKPESDSVVNRISREKLDEIMNPEYVNKKFHDKAVAEKDKEIAELKDLLRKDHERECMASLNAEADISATPVLADKPAEKCDYCGEKLPCLNRCYVDMDPSRDVKFVFGQEVEDA